MSDDDDIIDFPKPKRGRPTTKLPLVPSLPADDRERLTAWMRERLEIAEQLHQERIELLRTHGEHPSPVFAKIVRFDGSLGMPKNLVARQLGLTTHQLELHYGEDYEIGAAEILRAVSANALRIATSTTHPDAARVAMQVLDRRGGEEWRPPAQKLEVKTQEAPPLIDSSKLTFEEREQMRVMLTRIANEGAQSEGVPNESGQEENG